MGRAPCCEKINGLKKGPWTAEEDHKLTQYIQIHGPGNWRTLPRNAGLERCGKSCRLRWTNYLRPDIKRGRFSFEEEEAIIQLHSVLGNKWSAIAARLPGRTDNEIKNYWNTHVRKRLLRNGIDPVTHTPRIDILHELTNLMRLNNSTPCNGNTLFNLSHLLLNQHIVNPQLFNLATSLLTLQQQQQSHEYLPHNAFEMQNNPNMAQFQQFQKYPSSIGHAQQLMQGEVSNPGSIDNGIKVESFKSSPMSSSPDTTSPSNFTCHELGNELIYNQGCQQENVSSQSSFESLFNSTQKDEYSLDSILSKLNNGSIEDNYTYCSNLFNFETSEGWDMSYLL